MALIGGGFLRRIREGCPFWVIDIYFIEDHLPSSKIVSLRLEEVETGSLWISIPVGVGNVAASGFGPEGSGFSSSRN